MICGQWHDNARGWIGLWPNWYVAELACVRIGVWPNWRVAELACGRIGLWPNWLRPNRFVAELTCFCHSMTHAMHEWLMDWQWQTSQSRMAWWSMITFQYFVHVAMEYWDCKLMQSKRDIRKSPGENLWHWQASLVTITMSQCTYTTMLNALNAYRVCQTTDGAISVSFLPEETHIFLN